MQNLQQLLRYSRTAFSQSYFDIKVTITPPPRSPKPQPLPQFIAPHSPPPHYTPTPQHMYHPPSHLNPHPFIPTHHHPIYPLTPSLSNAPPPPPPHHIHICPPPPNPHPHLLYPLPHIYTSPLYFYDMSPPRLHTPQLKLREEMHGEGSKREWGM